MDLDSHGREFYTVEIVTTPQLTGWEASFDDGATWVAGAVHPTLANTWRWLLAGENAAVGTAVAVVTSSFRPHIRATDNPEIVVRRKDAPRINYIAA